MEQNTTYKNYTANEIMAYLKGTMPIKEMYVLEKQALEDPILADAIEGYALLLKEEQSIAIDALKSEINAPKVVDINKAKNNKKLIYRLAAAATLIGIIFGLANYFFKNEKLNNTKTAELNTNKIDTSNFLLTDQKTTKNPIINTDKKDSLVVNKTTPPSTIFISPDQLSTLYQSGTYTDVVAATPNTIDTTIKVFKQEDITDDISITKSAAPAPTATQNSAEENKEEVNENTLFNGNTNSTNAINNNVYSNRKVIMDKAVLAKTNTNIGKPNYNNFLFNYKITNDQGNFLPFANISIPNDQISTYSRVDGKFGLFSADSVLYVNIKANGYLPQTVALTPAIDYKNIVLQKDENSNSNAEKVVVAKAKSNNAYNNTDQDLVITKIEVAEPIDGIDNYKAYINNNFQNNAEVPKGEVVLSFDIDAQGQPTNIKVDKSLNAIADQEAIRILSQGPKWKSKKKKVKKGKIVFKL